ncbi:MAG TPA: hypothetical protein VN040_24375 [Pseudosphingobacterium sp.]|nr:hypothetical protein [Pseudosphingobacterium sp.]
MELQQIIGGIALDDRGNVRFANGFDMSPVKRFYIIQNTDTSLVRGWRGHEIEQRWFYVLDGSFQLSYVKIDNWDRPSKDLLVKDTVLNASQFAVTHIPVGYATSLKALSSLATLLVFADYPIEHAKNDDHVYPLEYFSKAEK